jgi:Outer membrane protein beta-barrel domain
MVNASKSRKSERSKEEWVWHESCNEEGMKIQTVIPYLALGAALSIPLLAGERVSVGVKGGVPITDAFQVARGNNAAYFTNTKRYLVGPTVEFHLPARFSVEVDALYKRLGYQYEATGPSVYSKTVANSWEFPLLAKFEILPGPVRPFIDAGVSLRHLTGIRQIRQTLSGATLNQVEINNAVEFNKRNDLGLVFGFGVAFKLGPVRISPELRYTRWGGENLRDPVNALLRTNRNQGDFLLGFTF